jgi:hypothetical protein
MAVWLHLFLKKSKVSHYRHAGDEGERNYRSYSLLTSALDGVSGQPHASAALYMPGKDPRYPLDRRLGGPQSRSGHRGKILCLCLESSPGRPVRSTDQAITAPPLVLNFGQKCGDEWSASSPGRFAPGDQKSGTHWIVRCVGSRPGLDGLPCREPNPCRPVLPNASRLFFSASKYFVR